MTMHTAHRIYVELRQNGGRKRYGVLLQLHGPESPNKSREKPDTCNAAHAAASASQERAGEVMPSLDGRTESRAKGITKDNGERLERPTALCFLPYFNRLTAWTGYD